MPMIRIQLKVCPYNDPTVAVRSRGGQGSCRNSLKQLFARYVTALLLLCGDRFTVFWPSLVWSDFRLGTDLELRKLFVNAQIPGEKNAPAAHEPKVLVSRAFVEYGSA